MRIQRTSPLRRCRRSLIHSISDLSADTFRARLTERRGRAGQSADLRSTPTRIA